MKRFSILMIFACLVMALANAQEIAVTEPLKLTEINRGTYTQSIDSVTSSVPITGQIESIVLTHSGVAARTNDIDIVSTNVWFGQERTIWSKDNVTADATVYPRVPAETTGGVSFTNGYEKITLWHEYVVLRAYNSDNTNSHVQAILIYTKPN